MRKGFKKPTPRGQRITDTKRTYLSRSNIRELIDTKLELKEYSSFKHVCEELELENLPKNDTKKKFMEELGRVFNYEKKGNHIVLLSKKSIIDYVHYEAIRPIMKFLIIKLIEQHFQKDMEYICLTDMEIAQGIGLLNAEYLKGKKEPRQIAEKYGVSSNNTEEFFISSMMKISGLIQDCLYTLKESNKMLVDYSKRRVIETTEEELLEVPVLGDFRVLTEREEAMYTQAELKVLQEIYKKADFFTIMQTGRVKEFYMHVNNELPDEYKSRKTFKTNRIMIGEYQASRIDRFLELSGVTEGQLKLINKIFCDAQNKEAPTRLENLKKNHTIAKIHVENLEENGKTEEAEKVKKTLSYRIGDSLDTYIKDVETLGEKVIVKRSAGRPKKIL